MPLLCAAVVTDSVCLYEVCRWATVKLDRVCSGNGVTFFIAVIVVNCSGSIALSLWANDGVSLAKASVLSIIAGQSDRPNTNNQSISANGASCTWTTVSEKVIVSSLSAKRSKLGLSKFVLFNKHQTVSPGKICILFVAVYWSMNGSYICLSLT